jgi:DeoR/GlpR family transcriptional regulator of sugar metabolism
MLIESRYREIIALLVNDGSVRVKDLAGKLRVSDDTVRRDLEALEKQGILQKTHGGAISLDVPRMDRVPRQRIAPEAKARIGEAAAAMVSSGQTVILDAGQTVLEAARRLPPGPMTVITQSLDVAVLLSERSDIRLVLTGGEWDRKQRFFRGISTAQAISSYRADIALLGACAVHPTLGVTATDDSDAAVKRAIIHSSERRILLVDHTKFNRHESFAVAALHEFNLILTDKHPGVNASGPQIEIV